MRVAIAVSSDLVAEHFGHCEYFNVYEIDKKTILKTEKIKNPPHQKGYLPNFLKERNIDVLITGSIGEMAVKGLESFNIKALRGVKGNPAVVIESFIEEKLITSNAICDEHQGHSH